MAVPTGFDAYYNMSVSPDGAIRDVGPYAQHGSVSGSVTQPAGKLGTGLKFTAGAGNYVEIADSPFLRLFRNTTISFWVYVHSYTNGVIISRNGDYPTGVRTEATGSKFIVSEGGGNKFELQTWVTTGSWHLVILTLDGGTTLTAYVDDPTNSRTTGTTGYFWMGEANSTPWRLGAPASSFYNSGTAAADVTIDELVVYSRVLTQAERLALWNSGNAATIATTGLILDEQGARKNYQRRPSTRSIPFTGLLTNTNAVSIEYRVLGYTSGNTVVNWSPVSEPLIDGVYISGLLPDVAESTTEWHQWQLRTLDASGNVLETSLGSVGRIGVGLNAMIWGQSNGHRMQVEISPGTPSDNTAAFSADNWGTVVGDGDIELANQLHEQNGVTTGIINVSVPGSGMSVDVGSGKWDDLTDGEPYAEAIAIIDAAGGDFEVAFCAQAEADATGAATTEAWKQAAARVQRRFQDHIRRTVRTSAFGYWAIGTNVDSLITDAALERMRFAHDEYPDEVPNAFHAGSHIDSTRIDDNHYGSAGYKSAGWRGAQGYSHYLGRAAYGGRGPRIKSATMNGPLDIYVNVDVEAGYSLTGVSNAASWAVTDGTSKTVSTITIEGTQIHLVLASAITGKRATVQYLPGRNPTLTGLIYDTAIPLGAAVGRPLVPSRPILIESNVVAQKIAGVTGDLGGKVIGGGSSSITGIGASVTGGGSGSAAQVNNAKVAVARLFKIGSRADGVAVVAGTLRMVVGESYPVWIDLAKYIGDEWLDDATDLQSSGAGLTAGEAGINRELLVMPLTAVTAGTYTATALAHPRGSDAIVVLLNVIITDPS